MHHRSSSSGSQHRPNHLKGPKRKALLIGIRYSRGHGREDHELLGPHRDVYAMKNLLISVYNFKEKDITLMLDGVGDKKHEPKRSHIIREIRHLVSDAAVGDQFFFHFSGHSTQMENRTGTESDKQDEAIIPSDSNKFIVDDKLKRLLVNQLPAGSSLVAVFDSCHSGSILDLDHHRCNRVYVPWVNKGDRDPDPLRNRVVRANDIPLYMKKKSSGESSRARSTKERSTSLRELVLDTNCFFKSDIQSPTHPEPELCESPISRFCEGWCNHSLYPEEKGHVLCFSASKDRQQSWENDGDSMTMAFVRALEKKPDPSLRELMTRISHDIHRLLCDLHDAAREKRHWEMQENPDPSLKDLPDLEMNNFQNPQLSSHRPLDLDAIFSL